MKKILLTLLCGVAVLTISAREIAMLPLKNDNGAIQNASWSPFQLTVVPVRWGQLLPETTPIHGLALGVFLLEQESAVISVSASTGLNANYGIQVGVATWAKKNYGLDVGPLINMTARNYGMQIGILNIEGDEGVRKKEYASGFNGAQIGLFNFGEGFQIGILNFNPKGFCLWFPIINFNVK